MKRKLKLIKVRRLKNIITLILVYEKENGECVYKKYSFIDECINNYLIDAELDKSSEVVSISGYNCKMFLTIESDNL